MGRNARQFEGFYRDISRDIFKFSQALKFYPTWQQAQLLNTVQRGYQKIAVRSGQGPGKTTASAVVGMWRLLRPWSKLIVTAPTMRQCKDAWLAEAERLLREANHPALNKIYKITTTSIGMFGQKAKSWGCLLITSTKTEQAQGQHNKNMDIIAEEASGISREIMEQYKGTLSNPNALFLQIGNPNTRDCAFFDCFHSQKHRWHRLHWNAEETPETEWFTRERNREFEEEYGRDSDVYRIRVLGEFPHTDPNCVISSELLERVTDRKLLLPASQMPRLERYGGGLARQFGQDFARFGGDENTIFRRSGNAIVEWEHMAHTDPSIAVDIAFRMQKAAGWRDSDCWYVADAGGMGQGIMHRFYDAGKNVVEFHNGGKSGEQDFDDKITEAWFHAAHMVKKGRCYIPRDNRTLQQLSNRQYFTTRKGKLKLESKDDYMKRGHDSPDRADGIVMALYDAVRTSGNISAQGQSEYLVGTRVQRN